VVHTTILADDLTEFVGRLQQESRVLPSGLVAQCDAPVG
jgi:hypothetical protein